MTILTPPTVVNSAINATKSKYSMGIIQVSGNTTDIAGKWTASSEYITEYFNGLTIGYYITVEGASTTSLNINNLGAVTVRRDAGNLTTHLPVGTLVLLTYSTASGTAYWHWADYDANNYAYVRHYNLTSSSYNKEYYVDVNSESGDSTDAGKTSTRYVGYSTKIKMNPYTGNLAATTFNGYTLADACAKSVVTTIDTSESLPTSNAVKTELDKKQNQITISSTAPTSPSTGDVWFCTEE